MKNKKKNGFIATSLMFSFFIIFLTMSLMILATYTHYQGLINNLNSSILTDLNENVIMKKYTTLSNSILDGDMVSAKTTFDETSWNLVKANARAVNDTENQVTYIELFNTAVSRSAHFSQRINESRKLKVSKDIDDKRVIYVRFNLFRNGTINCSSSSVKLRLGSVYKNVSDNICGGYSNWASNSAIFEDLYITEEQANDTELIFDVQNMYAPVANIDVLTLRMGINKVMVIDVTDAFMDSTTTSNNVKANLDANLPYFDVDYSIKKI